ncbi:MAG: CusA/CzcA family heavy metal efflux RND transporter [Deltaproteobacteria bacterium]|nr:CusA/CzcA family heavy metal efflux RND transporter [Deltaproteobacteria bacterium]
MLESWINGSVRHRGTVLFFAVCVLIAGVFAAQRLPIDAVPDLTNVQVQVLTDTPGLTAEEMERFVTRPVERGLTGLPALEEVRSITREGTSAVTVIFSESTDPWFARQLVFERLRTMESEIPAQYGRPELGPVTTGLGEIYQFVLKSDRHTPMQLRTMLDWDLAPAIQSVPGIIEVNAFGGAKQQYEVLVDPARLRAHRITLSQVFSALSRDNVNVGGGYVERGAEMYVLRGEGQLRTLDDVREVVVSADQDGTPVLIRHLAEVRVGAALAQGVVTQDGRGEVVCALVLMLAGQNSRTVVSALHDQLARVQRTLPEGVRIETVYDRKQFIDRTLKTVGTNLLEGAVLVLLVILAFLRTPRGALLVTLGIPFAMSIAIFGMLALNITGNLMSLGAIDFGFLVDGPIVMLEAVIAALAARTSDDPAEVRATVHKALLRVAKPVVFAVAIILLVYLPLLSLRGVEGKMFRPMAATMALALTGSLVFALAVFPAAAVTFLGPSTVRGHQHHDANRPGRYQRLVTWVLGRRLWILLASMALALSVIPLANTLGADFVPRIDEGDVYVRIRRIPSVGPTEARRLDLAAETVLRRFPEVVTTLGTTGRAEVALDPVGMDNTDILVHLRPRAEWRTSQDPVALRNLFKEAVEREIPSSFASVSQPIEDKTNDMISDSPADIAINIGGEDMQVLTDIGLRVGQVVRRIRGAGDVRVERAVGLPMLTVRVDRRRTARYGIATEDVLGAVEAARMGRAVGSIFEGQRRFDLRVLLAPGPAARGLPELPIGTREGQIIPLSQLATLEEQEGIAQIRRSERQRRISVEVNLRGRDLVSFVTEARETVAREVRTPPGYSISWAGQFENFQRAQERLALLVPVSLSIIVAMLYALFRNTRIALAVFACVPFALVGGVVSLALRKMAFSIPAAVGMIALCGIAVLNGVVMASEVQRRVLLGESLNDAIAEGASEVLRPLLLTASVAALGFLPMALSNSAGSEVQRPLATVVIGGLVSSTLLGALLLPAVLRIFMRPIASAEVLDRSVLTND